MSKASNLPKDPELQDEMLPEYDFSRGVRGKYFNRIKRNAQITLPGVQFLTDAQGRKIGALIELAEYHALVDEILHHHSDLKDFQYLVNTHGEKVFMLLEFDRHLPIWEALYDNLIANLPAYKGDLSVE